jgi:hypothetical protein
MLTIQPTGGLCNFLRVIFSYYEYTRKNNLELNIIWIKSNECPGYLLDYFEPIPHISFTYAVDKYVKIDYKGHLPLKNFKPKYDKLKLKPYIKKIIFDRVDILNKNYISVHIRRTDHIKLAKLRNYYTTDEDFIDFLDKSDKNIYIATDNKNSYNKFKEKYQERIKFEYHQTNEKSLRQTSLHDAIIDMYMCVYSNDFKGSGWSSFSNLIKNLRMINSRLLSDSDDRGNIKAKVGLNTKLNIDNDSKITFNKTSDNNFKYTKLFKNLAWLQINKNS